MADLIKLVVAAGENDELELAEALQTLASTWGEQEGAADLQLMLALLEERLGRTSEALERLRALAGEDEFTSPALWAEARLCLRSGERGDAVGALDRLVGAISDPVMRGALARLRAALATLAVDEPIAATGDQTEFDELTWALSLVSALEAGDRGAEAHALGVAARTCLSPALVGAARGASILAARSEEREPQGVPPEVADAGPYAEALSAFLGVGGDRSSWAPGFDRDTDPVSYPRWRFAIGKGGDL